MSLGRLASLLFYVIQRKTAYSAALFVLLISIFFVSLRSEGM